MQADQKELRVAVVAVVRLRGQWRCDKRLYLQAARWQAVRFVGYPFVAAPMKHESGVEQTPIIWAGNKRASIILVIKMSRLRPCSTFNCRNPNFLLVSLALLASYALLVYEYFIVQNGYAAPWLYLVTAFYAMSLWAYCAVVWVDPGRVPRFWGLMSQKLQGERKYCLVCHNFKPQRCHHCSRCGRCVLNMDHHCPWINNCVGFQNRKYFLQFLIYLVLALALALSLMAVQLLNSVKAFASGQKQADIHTVVKGVLMVLFVLLEPVLALFTYTHIRYVLANTTTLEQMVVERKRRSRDLAGEGDGCAQIQEDGDYNIASYYNFTQVFGANTMYWFFPLEEEAPLAGRGIYWENKHDGFNDHSLGNTVHVNTDV